MVNASEFEAGCPTEVECAFVVAVSDIVDYSSTLGTSSITIVPDYLDLAEVFSEEAANTLPEHGLQYLCLEPSPTSPLRPLYNLFQVELVVLWE